MKQKTPIKKLSLCESVRKRPGMYFGSTSSMGVNIAIYELIANAIDQYLAGFSTKISVQIEKDIIMICDDGKGLPFDKVAIDEHCSTLAQSYFLRRHNTPTADNHAPHIHLFVGGGLGLAVINSVCNYMKITSSNGVFVWEQTFGQGKVLSDVVKKETKLVSGTTIEMQLDKEIFEENIPDMFALRKILFEVAHFYPRLIVQFQEETFVSKNGLLDLAYMYYHTKECCSYLAPLKFFYEGILDGIQIQVACVGKKRASSKFLSWVNGSSLTNGGRHIKGLNTLFKEISWHPQLVLIHIIMHQPEFAGPTRGELKNKGLEKVVQDILREPLREYLASLDEYKS